MPGYMFFIAGVIGAIVSANLRDGGLELPTIVQLRNGTGKKLCLGCLVGLICGGFAGYYADNTWLNAGIWGFGGQYFIESGGRKLITTVTDVVSGKDSGAKGGDNSIAAQ
jgi:hypothetical protein